MKQVLRPCLLSAFMLLLLSAMQAQKDNPNVKDIKCSAEEIFRMFEKFHCSPRADNEQLYKDIAHNFIENMDPGHLYFTVADLQQLNNTQALKDELHGVNQNYADGAITLYKKRLTQVQDIIAGLASTPFDFTKNESVMMDPDSADFAADDKGLNQRNYLYLKLRTLDRLFEDAMSDSLTDKKNILQQEPDERAIVFKIASRHIKKHLETPVGFENSVRAMLYEAITQAFDPHSGYTAAIQVRKLKYGWGANAQSFGLRIKENEKGDVVIESLIAGSPAWKSGELNQGDVLLKLQFKDKPVVDLEGDDMDEVEAEFAALKGFKVQLTVRKADGSHVTVQLARRYSTATDDIVKAFILDGPKKIGYIMLPSFYSRWESNDGSGCAKDVIKQTLKLVKENVQGLIIDLRYNGGGSVQEANELAGILLDDGPLGFMKQKEGFLTTLKDPIPGVLYDDPVLILVNGESASASEYLASTLQDYHRAIIVGSPTYGKASAQRYLPVDTTISKVDVLKGKYDTDARDEVKVTVSKLYRVTGKSNQVRGLLPDIYLPDADDSLQIREKFNKYVLPADTLNHGATFDAFNPFPVKQLAEKSAQRIQNAKGFKIVEQMRQLHAEVQRTDDKPVSLKFDNYFDFNKTHAGELRKLRKQLWADSTNVFTVKNTAEDPTMLKWDPELGELDARFCRHVAHDVYVSEAFAIMTDYLELKK